MILFRLKEELNLLQQAKHKHVVHVYGWSKWPNSMALIMDYMPGGNLWRLLVDHDIQLAPVLQLRICAEIADGIAFIHNLTDDNRLTHGDLKPENILLCSDLHCRIGDFGGARLVKYTRSIITNARGQEKYQFTKAYAAPERLLRTVVRQTKEQDTYSYGIIVHGVLSREGPDATFDSDDAYIGAVKEGGRPDTSRIEELKQRVSEEDHRTIELLESVMTNCWEQDATKRPSMIMVRNDLKQQLSKYAFSDIHQSVTDALKDIRMFLPSIRNYSTIPLNNYNTRTGCFGQGMRISKICVVSTNSVDKPVYLS